MNITLYTFKKRINSLKVPSGGVEKSVLLKEQCSLYNPSFKVSFNPSQYNYVKFQNKYYYINDINYIKSEVFEIVCSIDVLASYRNEILNSIAYVQYSQSNFDDRIIDTRLSTVDRATIDSTSSVILTDGDVANPTFVLEYVTSKPPNGVSGVCWLKAVSAIALANKLGSEDFKTWLTENEKELKGAYDSVLAMRRIPLNWSSSDIEIYLGSWNSGISGMFPYNMKYYECDIDIPFQFNDFRNQQPFTSLMLFLPAHGFVEINPNDVIDKTSLHIKLAIDGITGAGTYIVDNIYKGDCNFAIETSIGTIKGNSLSTISSAVGVIGGLATGGIGGAISSAIQGVISSQQRSLGSTGRSSGGSSIYASVGDWKSVYLFSICHNTNQEPSSIAKTNGRPLNQNVSLSSLSGFTQTVNASVQCDNDDMATKINALLDGGVFIE